MDSALTMSWDQLILGLIDRATGPAGAVAVLVIVGAAFWWLLYKQLIPQAVKVIDRHLGQIDRLIATHDAEVKATINNLRALDRTVDTIHVEVRGVHSEVVGVRNDLRELREVVTGSSDRPSPQPQRNTPLPLEARPGRRH